MCSYYTQIDIWEVHPQMQQIQNRFLKIIRALIACRLQQEL